MFNEKRPPILVVDDDEDARALLQSVLSRDEYDVTMAASTEDALRKLGVLSFEVAIVDLRLPGLDGIYLLREIQRRWPDTLTIVLTAYAGLDSAVAALRAGAHDYLSKPCPPSEIRRTVQEGIAKRRGLIKRMELMRELEQQLRDGLNSLRDHAAPGKPRGTGPLQLGSSPLPPDVKLAVNQIIRAGPFIIDRVRHEALMGDTPLDLTPTEFEMLTILAERAPGVVSQQEMMQRALNYVADTREARDVIRWHIHHLRRKIEIDPDQPHVLVNVRGVGYKVNIT